MLLKNKIKIISGYTGKSKFDFWPKLEVGDILLVSIELKGVGRGGGGLYSVDVSLFNETRNLNFYGSMNEVINYLSKIGYEELNA